MIARATGGPSTTTVFSTFALVMAVIVFFIMGAVGSGEPKDEQARRAANPVPMWVAALGPVAAWGVFFVFMSYFISRPG